MAAQGIIDKKGHKRDICPFLTTMPWAGNKYCGIEILLQPRVLYKKKGHKRDICPFLPTLHWAIIKYCGRSQGGSKVPVVTLCGCPGHYRGKGTYVPFVPFGQLCLGQTKTGKMISAGSKVHAEMF